MAVSHLLLFTVTSAQLRHTSFAFLGCGWWLVVWWLVVGVVGGCCWWWWWPGVWHEISAPPNDTYESKMASPIIRTQLAYQRPRFFNPSGPWVGPRGPEGPKNFLGGWLAEPMSFEKKLETHPISEKSNSTESGSLRQKAKLVCRGCLCILWQRNKRESIIYILYISLLALLRGR